MRTLLVALLLITATSSQASPPVSLADGDRVVLLGNTLIEREQRYGYWETALVRLHPGEKIQFRNLGWSGDTVFGEARAGFGSVADGFKQLREHTLSLKPTVILLGYGSNESFQGADGLEQFNKGCLTLLDALAPAKARMVWLSPLRQEKLPLPLPDPALQNRNLALYTEAIANTAKNKDEGFIDLFHLKTESGTPLLTDNGIHLTADGYWVTAQTIDNGMGRKEKPWRRTLKAAGDSTSWEVTDETLPFPLPPDSSFPVPLERQRILKIEGLAPGTHTLSIDDKAVATAEAAAWALGVRLSSGPEYDQVEELRKAIIAKNRLYFYRWRPQNETYLFGFRKYEQGKNAVEIPQFDPLVAEKEAEIVKQAQPRKHVYKIQQAAKP